LHNLKKKKRHICSDNSNNFADPRALKELQNLFTWKTLNGETAKYVPKKWFQWVPGHAGVKGNEIADRLARSGSGQRFTGPEPFLGVSRQNIRKIKSWIEKHPALWHGPCGTQRQARELISGPHLVIGARLLSFNRTQSRVVIGLLTGHNTLRRHLHVMGISNDPPCRKCGTEEETSVHILFGCEALASLRHRYGFLLFEPGGC
jgi:hypothetical protein